MLKKKKGKRGCGGEGKGRQERIKQKGNRCSQHTLYVCTITMKPLTLSQYSNKK
jgi:hypothetical protein